MPHADFLLCALAAGVLLLQAFFPAVRRSYARSFRGLLLLIGDEERLGDKLQLLSRGTARLLFAWGLCLLPLVAALVHPHRSPGGLHVAGTLLFIVLPLALLSGLAALLWLGWKWRQLSSIPRS